MLGFIVGVFLGVLVGFLTSALLKANESDGE